MALGVEGASPLRHCLDGPRDLRACDRQTYLGYTMAGVCSGLVRDSLLLPALKLSHWLDGAGGLSRISRRPFVKDQPDPYTRPVPPAGLEPATCALRRRLVYGLGERTVPREFRCTICLVNHAAKQGPPPTLGNGWDRRGFQAGGPAGSRVGSAARLEVRERNPCRGC